MKILYGVRKNKKEHEEEIITENEKEIKRAKEWALKNGFDRFRIASIDLESKPDFTKSIKGL